jgi:hypothetical protein
VVGFEEGGEPAGMVGQESGELAEAGMGGMGGPHAEKGERLGQVAGLIEKEGFYMGAVGATAQQENEGQAAGDGEEGVGVHGLAEAAGDEPEKGLVPVGIVLVEQGSDEGGAAFKALADQIVPKPGPIQAGRKKGRARNEGTAFQ